MSTHLLIDIETLGLRENLPPGVMPEVVQVGAVIFDPATGEILEEFNFFPEPDNGGFDSATTLFWIDQIRNGHSADWVERRKAGNTDSLAYICQSILTAWNRNNCAAVWGNDPEMDLSPIEVWMRHAGLRRPWNYYQRQDVRTLRISLGLMNPCHPNKHDALADAKAEAALVADMLRKLKGVAA